MISFQKSSPVLQQRLPRARPHPCLVIFLSEGGEKTRGCRRSKAAFDKSDKKRKATQGRSERRRIPFTSLHSRRRCSACLGSCLLASSRRGPHSIQTFGMTHSAGFVCARERERVGRGLLAPDLGKALFWACLGHGL